MRRVTMMLVVMAVMVPLFAVVAYAAAGGNTANAQKCEEGGYLDYTKSNGDPFKNEGQCTSYAARGGQLVPVPVLTPDITITYQGFDSGTISGTGFTPNSEITVTRTYSPVGQSFTGITQTDATGAFTFADDLDFCFGTPNNTSIEVTATDSAGVSATESLAFSCG